MRAASLLDEPTFALDPGLAGDGMTVVPTLAEKNVTMVLVTREMGVPPAAPISWITA